MAGDVPLEALGDDRFQLFCQSLLSYEFPELQALPVNQPDGGRDAIARKGRRLAPAVVFQVKFVRVPEALDDPEEWIRDTLRNEKKKVESLAERGAERYVLVTNAPGSAHLDGGAVDRVDRILSSELPIPARCWWRNDVEIRLAKHPELKWHYRELLTGTDVMRELLEAGLSEDRERRLNAIHSFLSAQYKADKSVRFRQVDLNADLIDLFVDVPAHFRRSSLYSKDVALVVNSLQRNAVKDTELPQRRRDEFGGADVVLDPAFQTSVRRAVIEGAPGQGKSTLTQYVSQVHRMRLLGRETDIARVEPRHAESPLKLPFRVDLRQFGAFLEGEDPFERIPTWGGMPDRWPRSLEGFLAAQVLLYSGGADFSVSDLQAVARASPLLILLDGLDEVADIQTRRALIEAVNASLSAIEGVSPETQVVITSRPAAFANSPGFSPKEYVYLSLTSLTRAQILDYAQRWGRGRGLPQTELSDTQEILADKLGEAHMRDLARNPMQLAILLNLIEIKGESLPDRRTELYSAYMGRYFDREAAKNTVVRKYRKLLYNLHGFLGWRLHAAAERTSSGGAIEVGELERIVTSYLKAEGAEDDILRVLFERAVDRIFALVSREEGTLEFEVQPLREFFAAQYLYESAQVARFGEHRPGTREARLAGVIRNSYWLNVARFYAGFFASGELPVLVDRLDDFSRDPVFGPTDQPREVTAMLLGDWTFALDKRSRERAIRLVLEGLGTRHVLSARSSDIFSPSKVVLPTGSGREEVAQRSWVMVKRGLPADREAEMLGVLGSNISPSEFAPTWLRSAEAAGPTGANAHLRWGSAIGVLGHVPAPSLENLVDSASERAAAVRSVLAAGLEEMVESDDSWTESIVLSALAGNVQPFGLTGTSAGPTSFWLNLLFEGPVFGFTRRTSPRVIETMLSGLQKRARTRSGSEQILRVLHVLEPLVSEMASVGADIPSIPVASELIERSRQAWGDQLMTAIWAAQFASVQSRQRERADLALLDHRIPLINRLIAARGRAGISQQAWWREQTSAVGDGYDGVVVTLAVGLWTAGSALAANIGALNDCVDEMSLPSYAAVLSGVRRSNQTSYSRHPELASRDLKRANPRLAAVLCARTPVTHRREFYEQSRLPRYRGADPVVLDYCLDFELGIDDAIRGKPMSADWPRAISLARRAYRHGKMLDLGMHLGRILDALPAYGMPADVAAAVVADARAYPYGLVSLAERRCRFQASQSAIPLATVARTDRWFSA